MGLRNANSVPLNKHPKFCVITLIDYILNNRLKALRMRTLFGLFVRYPYFFWAYAEVYELQDRYLLVIVAENRLKVFNFKKAVVFIYFFYDSAIKKVGVANKGGYKAA